MDDNLKAAFEAGIRESLPILRALLSECTEPRYQRTRGAQGTWQWTSQQSPNFQILYGRAQSRLTTITDRLAEPFFAQHPQYKNAITSALFHFSTAGVLPKFLPLQRVFEWLWDKHRAFHCEDSCIQAAVAELDAATSRPTTLLRFYTVLVDYSMTESDISLPGGLRIRKMTDDETAELSNREFSIFFRPLTKAPEFVLEGECEETMIGDTATRSSPNGIKILTQLSRIILALRTFKRGAVSRGCVHFKPLQICFFYPHTIGYGMEHQPFGMNPYSLTSEEIAPLRAHVQLVTASDDEAMEIALNRLADAEARIRPQDRLLDAVIGMEALLLAGRSDSELRYRFSLRYSTLFETAEARHRAYKVAGDLYSARSKIAHGNYRGDRPVSVDSEQLTLSVAAERATECLRGVVKRFLPGPPEYRKDEFWERAYFGLSGDR